MKPIHELVNDKLTTLKSIQEKEREIRILRSQSRKTEEEIIDFFFEKIESGEISSDSPFKVKKVLVRVSGQLFEVSFQVEGRPLKGSISYSRRNEPISFD